MVAFEIDHKKGLPIYLQIIEQIKHFIATGKLSVGEQLPTVRTLSVQLSVNVNTIAKAYTELEQMGVVETRQGIGTFVKKQEIVLEKHERAEKLHSLASAFIDEAVLFGYTPNEITETVQKLIRELIPNIK
jgi:GntR family transcriptional regulator